MKLSGFDRAICIGVDLRYPEWSDRARAGVRARGIECGLYLNGRDRLRELGAWRYRQINQGPVPQGWHDHPGAYWLALAFRQVVRDAVRDRIERLLIVEDDLLFTADYESVTDAIRVPDDWGLLYYGASHRVARTEEISRHLLRVRGSLMTHCVGLRGPALSAVAGLDLVRPIDCLLASLHESIPAYACWPSVAIQAPGVSTITGFRAGDPGSWAGFKGVNWPSGGSGP